ncbi:hypothetical protein HYQ45_001418 [Verticillium longisporum]|uniref:Transcription factor domain-containing protein n=1 Tax=Verticillium longisporum TaxID=100787 RepID=A0A8I3A173_VERLO|nr:hypothetical protein HYQ45_001418 [Verticillium longisporum]
MHANLKATVGDRLLLVIDFCISVTAVGLFSSAYLGHHRDRLWEFGGVEGWNSNPKERVYFYANYKEPPVIPLIWTQRLTDASLAVALLSIFIMVARMVMTSCGQMSRTFSMLYDAFLAFVWIYSVSSQASGDYSDMEHPSPHPCARFAASAFEVAYKYWNNRRNGYQLVSVKLDLVDEDDEASDEDTYMRERRRYLHQDALSPPVSDTPLSIPVCPIRASQVETVTFVAGAGSSVIWDVPPANDASTPFAQSPSAISSPAATFALTPTLHTRELREPWRTHSIPLLINCYAPVAFFSAIFEKLTSPDEPLIMATHLWARVYLGSCFHAPQDRRETALHLGNTLRSVALAIQDRDKGTSDGTILAVWILGMYELQIGGISGQSSRKSAWHVHLEGLLSLLRARGKAQFYTPFGRYIFWYICKACSLISTIFPMVCEGLFDEARRHYHSLLEQVSALEHECLRWMAQAAPEELAPSSHTHFFWNIWRSARLKLHNLFFMLANLVLHTPMHRISQSAEIFDSFMLEATKDRCLAIVATAAQETIDSIPVSLGGRSPEFATATYASWFEGMSQISPLSHVYTTRTVPKHLRNTARLALLAIGKERGILQAFKTRPGAVQYAAEAAVGISLDDTMENVTEVT